MTTRRITCPVCDDYYSWCKITKVGVHIFRAATEEKRKKLKNKPHCDYLKEHAKKKTTLTLKH